MKRHDNKFAERKADLYKAILNIKNVEEAASFFDDIATPSEIEALSDRLLVANLLLDKLSYREIAEKTGVSVTTVTRVARCLFAENSGYKRILERIRK